MSNVALWVAEDKRSTEAVISLDAGVSLHDIENCPIRLRDAFVDDDGRLYCEYADVGFPEPREPGEVARDFIEDVILHRLT